MKRVTLFSGHYGSGKTNIAVNYAIKLKKDGHNVSAYDLDIVNPYFRTQDSKDILNDNGIRLVCSPYANTNLDIPALPQEIYCITDDLSSYAVVDVGGDDRGALALGRIAEKLAVENNYEMFLVINCFRPLTRNAQDVLQIKEEIENACKLRFTGIVNNSNLGEQTTAKDILSSVKFAEETEKLLNLQLKMTCCKKELYEELAPEIDNLFPLELQNKIY